jgi:hypothetical protein
MNTRTQLHFTKASANDRRKDPDFLGPSQSRLAALAGFVHIPNRGSLEKRADPPATCGFVMEVRLPWFAWFDPNRKTAAER